MTAADERSVALGVAEFVRQVERECADLPEATRRRLMVDLETHLAEMADFDDRLELLGTPAEYARELRSALDLPEGAPAGSRLTDRRSLLAIAVALVLVVGVTVVVVAASTSSHSSNHHTDLAAQRVVVPYLIGDRVNTANLQLRDLGLVMSVRNVSSTSALPGTVIAQSPAANTRLSRGAKVAAVVAAPPPG